MSFDEQVFNGAAGELNGLFTQAAAVTAATVNRDLHDRHRAIRRVWSTVRHAYDLSDLRAVIGSKTFGLYAGLFANSNKGDMSLFDYLSVWPLVRFG